MHLPEGISRLLYSLPCLRASLQLFRARTICRVPTTGSDSPRMGHLVIARLSFILQGPSVSLPLYIPPSSLDAGRHSLSTLLRKTLSLYKSRNVCFSSRCLARRRGHLVGHCPRNHMLLLLVSGKRCWEAWGSPGDSALVYDTYLPYWMQCRSGYPQIRGDPPVSASRMLGLKACATTTSQFDF